MNTRIEELRKSLKLTRAAFGARIGASGDTVNNWERKGVIPNDTSIMLICREFAVSEDWLRYGTGEMIDNKNVEFGMICAEIGIKDERAKNFIEKYFKLSDENKELFWKFIDSLQQ